MFKNDLESKLSISWWMLVVSNIFNVHPYFLGRWSNLTRICFKWVAQPPIRKKKMDGFWNVFWTVNIFENDILWVFGMPRCTWRRERPTRTDGSSWMRQRPQDWWEGLIDHEIRQYGGFLKWWYPTTMGFPTKNDHFGGTTISGNTHMGTSRNIMEHQQYPPCLELTARKNT